MTIPRVSGRIVQAFKDADADHDGNVSRAEAKAGADRRFDATDADHDGTVTSKERRAARSTITPQ